MTEKQMIWKCPSCGKTFPRHKGQLEVRCICGVVMTATVESKESSKQLEVLKD